VGAIPGCVLDVNFYIFPQGEPNPGARAGVQGDGPHEYLEQFGAIPATSRDRVFPEFKEKVHEGEGEGYDYDPALRFGWPLIPPVEANPYCVLAIQDYGDMLVIFE